ncbi:MAG: alpha-xylosidase, partial [Mediterranea sp.]|nr:alpha-xylosidase [Mediterranea sp.]
MNKPFTIALLLAAATSSPAAGQQQIGVVGATPINPAAVEIVYTDGHRMTLDFYGENIFRLFRDDAGGVLRDPEARPPARILQDNPRKPVAELRVNSNDSTISVSTQRITVRIDRRTALMTVTDGLTGATVLEEAEPLRMENGSTTLTLKEAPQEYFYGGGVQNGRFSHKGKAIAIENQNSWTDGGVASPNPFCWSTNGYAILWYTFRKGKYDFGLTEKGRVKLTHETGHADLFVMVDAEAEALLGDYYQLTDAPALLPKFGLYQGHLNAYNRDYWKEDPDGILFEDGHRYKESQKDGGGGSVKESLNGENGNYRFSARAVIDRYAAHDMPLGWLLPNDGYGAGYGQTGTLDGNIANLKELTA